MQLTPSSFVAAKMSCSSTHCDGHQRHPKLTQAKSWAAPRCWWTAVILAFWKWRQAKEYLGSGSGLTGCAGSSAGWALLVSGIWGGAGVLQAEPSTAFLAQMLPCPSATLWDLALPCYPGWMEMSEVTLTSHYKVLVWDTGNSGCSSSSRVQQHLLCGDLWGARLTTPCTRLV